MTAQSIRASLNSSYRHKDCKRVIWIVRIVGVIGVCVRIAAEICKTAAKTVEATPTTEVTTTENVTTTEVTANEVTATEAGAAEGAFLPPPSAKATVGG